MEYVQIENLPQKASRIGLGTWAIGGWLWGGTDEKLSIATILHAFDVGINLIDTAPAYGFGLSEEFCGKALKQFGNRDKIIIATKVGLSWDKQNVVRDLRKETILKEAEDSLRRLQIDYIDLYQVHWPDTLVPLSEVGEALHSLLKSGKIRSVGVSNYTVAMIEEIKKFVPIHCVQPPFNLFEREIENDILPYCIKQKIITLGYGSLCRGLLSGRMKKDTKFSGDDIRKGDKKFQEPTYSHYLNAIKELNEWVESKHKRPLIALAVRWALDQGISIALCGGRSPQQLDYIPSVFGWHLSKDDMCEIDQILQKNIAHPLGTGFTGPSYRKK